MLGKIFWQIKFYFLISVAMSSNKKKEVEEEEVEEYVVEKILDKMVDSDGKAKYFLKWKGYPE